MFIDAMNQNPDMKRGFNLGISYKLLDQKNTFTIDTIDKHLIELLHEMCVLRGAIYIREYNTNIIRIIGYTNEN
jgi:hypothetical protein